jgi:formate dehydrogenase gamma subunit
MRKQAGFSEHFMSGYGSSVHGQALAAGNEKTATCSSCHGSHDITSTQRPASMTNRSNIDATCGTCHTDSVASYKDSSHGQAAARGNADAPTCATCHGDHHVYSAQDPRSSVSRDNIEQTCVGCHNAMKSRQESGIASGSVNFYFNSFHGIPSKSGSLETPTCASCHRTHGIKPPSDPDSPVHPNNVATTCGNCHPGANATFAVGKVHTTEVSVIPFWIRNIYIVLIVATIGLMFLHNLLDFIRQIRRRSEIRRGLRPPAIHSSKRYVRMTLLDRVQHVGLLVSFLTLTVTGFMLRFPDAWWVSIIKSIWMPFFEMRGYIHRGAAAVLILFSLFHVFVLIFTRHGRKFAWDMFPKWSDVKDVFANTRYLLGLSSEKARFDRFSYGEKAEYWALVWGTVIMAASGIFLLFFIFFMNHFGKIGWEIARTVHFYEAILAALAIVVWHFYFVMFSPSIFPMNTTWITGKVSEEEMAEEHPLELERIQEQESQTSETHTIEPPEK